MKASVACAAAFLIAFSAVSHAAGRSNVPRKHSELTPAQLGDSEVTDDGGSQTNSPLSAQVGEYSLNLDTTERRVSGAPDPAGLSPLRQEPIIPGLGLKLTRPLPNNFWNFGTPSDEQK